MIPTVTNTGDGNVEYDDDMQVSKEEVTGRKALARAAAPRSSTLIESGTVYIII